MLNICCKSFWYALGAAAWISLVAIFTQNANDWFGREDTILSVMAIMILFSITALIVGGLLAGRPIFLYIDGKKKEAVGMLAANAGWLVLFFMVALVILGITN